MRNEQRRIFLKQAGLVVGGLILLSPFKVKSEEKRRGGGAAGADMVDENAASAKAVSYKADSAKVSDKKVMIDRQGVPFKSQTCANCGLFQGKAGDASGGCPIFGAQKVSAKGWCSSWNKKA